jgi:hypothetical protein
MDIVRRLFSSGLFVGWLGVSVDFLVLAAILWFELPEWHHERRANKLAKQMRPHLLRGRELHLATPDHAAANAYDWDIRVVAWENETEQLLGTMSPHAALAFSLTVNASDTVRKLTGRYGDTSQRLQAKLFNLSRIVEQPASFV